MEFIVSYGMPYSGTTVFAKSLATAIDACTVNSRAEGVWELTGAKPDLAEGLLKARWNPNTPLVDRELVDHWLQMVEGTGKQYLVEKSPPLMFHRASLQRCVDVIREFVLIRDPVQLYLSNRKRQKIGGRRLKSKQEQMEKTTPEWTEKWFDLYFHRLDKMTEILSDGAELIVYEDFVADPDGYLEKLSVLNGITINKLADSIEVKGEQAEPIEIRDKVPEEWLSDWELSYIESTLNENTVYRNLYQDRILCRA